MPGLGGAFGAQIRRAPERQESPLTAWINRPARQGLNFLGDLGTLFMNKRRDSYGTGAGDQIFGVTPGYYDDQNKQNRQNIPMLYGMFGDPNNAPKGGSTTSKPKVSGFGHGAMNKVLNGSNVSQAGPGSGGGIEGPQSFADALRMVQELMSGQGMGGNVSYDPLRAQARQQWSEADARTLAMYNQLQDSIRSQAAPLGAVYDDAINNTNATTEFTNQQNQESAQAVNSMVSQQAGALGIQEAVANDINAGNLSGQDQVARAADTAARGQISANMLNSGKAGALDFNSDLVGSAALAGGEARLQRSNELSRLLAQYDVEEQQANAQSQGDFQKQSMDLASMLFGQSRDDYEFDVTQQRLGLQEANEQERFLMELMGKSSGSGTDPYKVMPLGRNAAYRQALDDFGYKTVEEAKAQNALEDIIKQANKYQRL
jgi:hypothetical protein